MPPLGGYFYASIYWGVYFCNLLECIKLDGEENWIPGTAVEVDKMAGRGGFFTGLLYYLVSTKTISIVENLKGAEYKA